MSHLGGPGDVVLSLSNIAAYYGINDRLEVGLSVLGWGIPTDDDDKIWFKPMELHAKLGIISDLLALELNMPWNFTSSRRADKDRGFELDGRAILSIMMFNANIGFDVMNLGETSGNFIYGLGVVPSVGPAFVGAEFTGNSSGDYGWGIGAGIDVRILRLSLGFGGNFETNEALGWSLGLRVAFGGK
jgi:hypothetical protein